MTRRVSTRYNSYRHLNAKISFAICLRSVAGRTPEARAFGHGDTVQPSGSERI